MKITTLLLYTTAALALPIPQWFSDLRNLPLRHVTPIEAAAERLHPVLPRTANFDFDAVTIGKNGNDGQDRSAIWLNPLIFPRHDDDSTGFDNSVQSDDNDIQQRSSIWLNPIILPRNDAGPAHSVEDNENNIKKRTPIWRSPIILPRDDADPAGVVDDAFASARSAFESKYTHNTGGVPFGVGPGTAWIDELFRLPRASTEDV